MVLIACKVEDRHRSACPHFSYSTYYYVTYLTDLFTSLSISRHESMGSCFRRLARGGPGESALGACEMGIYEGKWDLGKQVLETSTSSLSMDWPCWLTHHCHGLGWVSVNIFVFIPSLVKFQGLTLHPMKNTATLWKV